MSYIFCSLSRLKLKCVRIGKNEEDAKILYNINVVSKTNKTKDQLLSLYAAQPVSNMITEMEM